MAFPTYGPGYLDFDLARERDQFTYSSYITGAAHLIDGGYTLW